MAVKRNVLLPDVITVLCRKGETDFWNHRGFLICSDIQQSN